MTRRRLGVPALVHELGDLAGEPLRRQPQLEDRAGLHEPRVRQLAHQHVRVREGVHRVARVADHERARLDRAPFGARRRGAAEEESLEHGSGRGRVLAHGVEPHVYEGMSPSRQPAGNPSHHPADRRSEGEPDKQRSEREGACEQGVVEHGHLHDQPLHPSRGEHRRLERHVGAQRRAAHHGPPHVEVIEQPDHLLAEQRHRVAPHVHRPVRLAMPEQVEDDHPVTALGERPRQRLLHLARQQQAGQQHHHIAPGAEIVIDEPLPVVDELVRGHGGKRI